MRVTPTRGAEEAGERIQPLGVRHCSPRPEKVHVSMTTLGFTRKHITGTGVRSSTSAGDEEPETGFRSGRGVITLHSY